VLTLTHEAFLPALAYVAAGKTQKRHLLLGECGWIYLSASSSCWALRCAPCHHHNPPGCWCCYALLRPPTLASPHHHPQPKVAGTLCVVPLLIPTSHSVVFAPPPCIPSSPPCRSRWQQPCVLCPRGGLQVHLPVWTGDTGSNTRPAAGASF
jgi:hypothetical protein